MPSADQSAAPLRPHHGLCLAYFQGYGYSAGFTRHMEEGLERLLGNPAVRLTVSPDEICAVCPHCGTAGCTSGGKAERYDRAVLAACGLGEGETMPFLDFARRVQERILVPGRREEICGGCQWSALCQGAGRWAALGEG